MPDAIKIAIVGGGIAGLALGAGLHRQHLDFHIYESVQEYRDVGAGLALHLNAIKAMALIGPEVRQTYFDKALDIGEEHEEIATEVILAEGPHSGQLVAELGKAKGRKTVSRADLLQGFQELIPRERITFGKRVHHINEAPSGVTVRFKDGEEIRADCLIGADGVHSVTRAYILGAEHPATPPKNHDGWQIYRTLLPMADARPHIDEKWTRQVPILLGPRGHINSMPLNHGQRLSAGVAVRGVQLPSTTSASTGGGGGGDAAAPPAAPPLDPALYKDYSEAAQKMVRLVARDPSASWTAADHDHAPNYYRGRVCVMGDAAHSSLPFSGQGAAQALEDGAVLAHLLPRVTASGEGGDDDDEGPAAATAALQIEAAFAAYDAVRRPRSQAVVDMSRKYGRVYAYAEEGMQNDPGKMRDFFRESAAFTNNADLVKQNDDAMALFLRAISS